MASITIESEKERGEGWIFTILIHNPDQPDLEDRRFEMTLSWADYDFWSGGVRSPSQVARDCIEFALTQSAETGTHLPGRFDASTLRRLFHNTDEELRGA